MKSDDSLRDPALTDALRQFDRAPNPSVAELRPLVRRIVSHAQPLMPGATAAPQSWWEFPASWARTLIPIGIATAAVGIGILWTTRIIAPAPLPGGVLAETNEMSSQQMLYSLVAPVEQQVVPAFHRPRR
jgi:hypothetical protein